MLSVVEIVEAPLISEVLTCQLEHTPVFALQFDPWAYPVIVSPMPCAARPALL